ncbi:MAG: FAD-dependent oxidoreductase [Actinomycetota bacterium]|nr:FAD-dependent oxidoreductase [Actinomycetota bacterium]
MDDALFVNVGVVGRPANDGRSFAAGTLLVATGRRPNTGGLDVDAGGVGLTDDGRIEADRYGRAAEGVWARGLRLAASAQARRQRRGPHHRPQSWPPRRPPPAAARGRPLGGVL